MRTVTIIILAILILIYLTPLNHLNSGIDVVDYPWRSLCHANFSHIFANGLSFIGLSSLENIIGSTQYLYAIIFIWLVSSYLLLGYHTIFPSKKVHTVGFSGVVFGLVIVYLKVMSTNLTQDLLGVAVSLIPQFFIPQISVSGHICGIIAGALYIFLFKPKPRPDYDPSDSILSGFF